MKNEIETAAATLISMCSDFLQGGITEDTFRANLGAFAEKYSQGRTKCEKVNIKYLKFDYHRGNVINKINEIIRYLNKTTPPFKDPPKDIVCPACGEIVRNKPAATGFHCILCGSALPEEVK